MALPDTTRLHELPPERWRALGARLTEMGIEAAWDEIGAIGGGLFEPASQPLRAFHLRRKDSAAHRALRMFCAGDPVPIDAANEALGADVIEELCGVGLLTSAGGEVVSPFRLRAYEGVLFFADHLSHGGDAVMGAGPLTGALLRACTPQGRVGAALDLGCGAGLVALLLSRIADKVVATDITLRAATMARLNAAMNGAANIEVRTGDLFEPLRGERFDCIASQPPFFPAPDALPGQAYSQGGRRGDELPLRLFAGVPLHLTPRGRATIIAEWPLTSDEPITDRIRNAVGPGANLLTIEADGPDVDAFCIGDTAFAHPGFGEEYARTVVAQRAHMEAMGIVAIRSAITVVEAKATGDSGWTQSFAVRDLLDSGVDARLVQSRFAARELLSRDREALFAARLRLRPGAVLATTGDGLSRVLFDRGAPMSDIRLDRTVHRFIEMVDASANVGVAAKRHAKESNGPRTAAMDRFAQAISQALAAGILDVVQEGAT